MLISVILPCYNGSRWLSKAIESVLSQTYRDFELLIIDDGSVDDSKAIISSFLSDRRVRYIYQKNRGFSAAINRGIKESLGDLIGFIGQDDLWLPKKLELQTNFLSKNKNIDLVHSSYLTIDSEDKIINALHTKLPELPTREQLIKKLFMGNLFGFETILVKRECFNECGFFNEGMIGFSDYDMWLRIAEKFNLNGFIARPLVKKREHKSRISKSRIEDVLRDELLIVEKAVALYPFLKYLRRKKLAILYYSLGICFLRKGESTKAKIYLIEVIRCQPWNLKSVAVLISPTLYRFILNLYVALRPIKYQT